MFYEFHKKCNFTSAIFFPPIFPHYTRTLLNVYIEEGEQKENTFIAKMNLQWQKQVFFWTDKAPIFFLVDAITIV